MQIAQGYHHFEFGLYFRELFLDRLTALDSLRAGDLVHTIVNNKYLGHFVMVLYFVATSRCRRRTFRTTSTASASRRRSPIPTSTATGRSCAAVLVPPVLVIAAVLLAIVTNLLWVRGTESSWRVRMNLAPRGLHAARWPAPALCLFFVGVGGYIYYNTHILNPYRTTFKIDEARAQYEKKYRQYWSLPQPRMTDVALRSISIPSSAQSAVRGTSGWRTRPRRHRPRRRDDLARWTVAVPVPHIEVEQA